LRHVPFYYDIFLSFSHLTKRYHALRPIWSPMFPLKVYKNPIYIYNKTENYYPPYSEDLKNLLLRSASSTFVNHLSSIVTIFLVTCRHRAFHQLYIIYHLSMSFASRSTSYWYALSVLHRSFIPHSYCASLHVRFMFPHVLVVCFARSASCAPLFN